MAEHAIVTKNLMKKYVTSDGEEVSAVRGIDLVVESGEIYALLGPNGAGKTSTIAMLTTLITPSSGSAEVSGFDVVSQPEAVRRSIGVTFQEVVLDEELTGRQVMEFHGRLYGQNRALRRERLDDLAGLVELSDVLDRKVGSYSGGMKRRLELARGLMTAPSILFLDEPTQGLDPQNRASIWRYIRRLRDEQGITLLLTTHYMDEAEALADRVGIIDHGHLVIEGVPSVLVRELGEDVVSISGAGDADAFLSAAEAESFVTNGIAHTNPGDDVVLLQLGVDSGDRRLAQLVQLSAGYDFHIHEISVSRPGLGDVFLAHTGHALRD